MSNEAKPARYVLIVFHTNELTDAEVRVRVRNIAASAINWIRPAPSVVVLKTRHDTDAWYRAFKRALGDDATVIASEFDSNSACGYAESAFWEFLGRDDVTKLT